MKVSEYIDYLVTGECSKLAIASVGDMALNPSVTPSAVQVVNQGKFLNYVNLANLAIHKRFNLLQKTFEMDQPIDGEEYDLPDNFLVPISAHYTADNDEVTIKDSSVNMVSSIDTAVSILIPEPFKAVIKGTDSEARDQIIMNYTASPITATRASLDLKVSEVYTEAMLNYAAYKAHSSISGDIKDENNTYYLRYDASCKQLVQSGMWGNNEIETNNKLLNSGFV